MQLLLHLLLLLWKVLGDVGIRQNLFLKHRVVVTTQSNAQLCRQYSSGGWYPGDNSKRQAKG